MATSWDRAYTRRQAIGVGAAGLGAFYLASCGGGSSADDGRDVAAVFDFEYGGPPGSMKRYWEELRKRLDASDVDARLTDITLVNYANMQARLQSAHAARQGPTIETWYPEWFTWEFISQDALTPAQDHVEAGASDDWLWVNEIEGKLWGAPYYAEQALLVANRDHLAKAGVEVGERVESWEAFVDACARIKRIGEIPVMVGASDGIASDQWAQASSMEFMDSVKQLGRNMLDELPTDEPVVSAWMDHFYELNKGGYLNPDTGELTAQQAIDRFLDGEGAFAMMNPGTIFDKDPKQFSIVGYWGGDARYSAPIAVSANCALITSYGANQAAAGRVIDFMQAPEQLKLFNSITGELPCNRRFDPSDLGTLARQSWDLLIDPGKGKVATWPRNYIPTTGVNVVFDLGPRAFAGEQPAALRAEYDRRMAKWRDQNSAEAEEFAKYLDSFEG